MDVKDFDTGMIAMRLLADIDVRVVIGTCVVCGRPVAVIEKDGEPPKVVEHPGWRWFIPCSGAKLLPVGTFQQPQEQVYA